MRDILNLFHGLRTSSPNMNYKHYALIELMVAWE